MSSHPRPQPASEQIACEVCHKEIPLSEAARFEVEDYMVYFCGLECYSTWKEHNHAAVQKDKEGKR